MDEFKLTEEDLAIAKSNGIHEKLAKFRYEHCAWELERAITQKPRVQNNLWPKYSEAAEKNGVSRDTFFGRIYRGWTPEEAAGRPPMKPWESGTRKPYKRKLIPEDVYTLAEKNGISRSAVYQRVHRYCWSFEQAATTPLIKGRRKPQ